MNQSPKIINITEIVCPNFGRLKDRSTISPSCSLCFLCLYSFKAEHSQKELYSSPFPRWLSSGANVIGFFSFVLIVHAQRLACCTKLIHRRVLKVIIIRQISLITLFVRIISVYNFSFPIKLLLYNSERKYNATIVCIRTRNTFLRL